MKLDPPDLWVLSDAECRRLLGSGRVGRVVVSMDAMPAAFPVNYVVIGCEIYFRTATGTKLASAVNRTVVAFQVDQFDSAGTVGWSVLVVGEARLVTDPDEHALLEAAGVHSWATPAHARYVAIAIDRISGRRLAAPPEAQPVLHPAAPSGRSVR